jgi:RNA-directed DNA polymerase
MERVTQFITHRLQLKVNQAKSAVAQPGQRKLLGFSFTGERGPRRRIAPRPSLALRRGFGNRHVEPVASV